MNVNGLLTNLGQNPSCGLVAAGEGDWMEWNFFTKVWDVYAERLGARVAVSSSDTADASEELSGEGAAITGISERKRKFRDWQAQRERRQRLEDQDDHDSRKATDTFLHLLLMYQQHEQAMRAFANDLSDAIDATRSAYTKALDEEEHTRKHLDALRGNAILLSDGRRVYFAHDGRLLFGEDRREIWDQRFLDEAQTIRGIKRDATSFEAYQEMSEKLAAATARSQHLAETLNRLDELSQQTKAGQLAPLQLSEARRELEARLIELPAEAREEFERLRSARKDDSAVSYRGADVSYESVPDMKGQFGRATQSVTLPQTEPEPSQKLDPQPAYKSAPEF